MSTATPPKPAATPAAPPATEAKQVAATTPAAPATPASTPATPSATPSAKTPTGPALGATESDEPALGVVTPEADDAPEGDAPEGDAKPAADSGDADKPIDYSFEAPEGKAPYRAPVIDAYKAVLQKHKVAPEVAREILDTMLPVLQADADTQQKEAFDKTTGEWREQLQQRHGNKLAEVIRLANRGLQKAATPELTAFLRDSALAVNPDFIDMLAFLGQRVSNDRPPKSTESTPRQPLTAVEEAALEYERNAARAQRGN
jgi:hypothetical protein